MLFKNYQCAIQGMGIIWKTALLKIALFKKNFFFMKKMASSSHKNIQQSTTKAVLCAARWTINEKNSTINA